MITENSLRKEVYTVENNPHSVQPNLIEGKKFIENFTNCYLQVFNNKSDLVKKYLWNLYKLQCRCNTGTSFNNFTSINKYYEIESKNLYNRFLSLSKKEN